MIAFIDDHRGAHGVEPICKVLPIAPRPTTPMWPGGAIPPSCRRARQDAALKIEVRRVFSPAKWSMLLEAVPTDLVFTISLKRSTQNLQLSTSWAGRLHHLWLMRVCLPTLGARMPGGPGLPTPKPQAGAAFGLFAFKVAFSFPHYLMGALHWRPR